MFPMENLPVSSNLTIWYYILLTEDGITAGVRLMRPEWAWRKRWWTSSPLREIEVLKMPLPSKHTLSAAPARKTAAKIMNYIWEVNFEENEEWEEAIISLQARARLYPNYVIGSPEEEEPTWELEMAPEETEAAE